MCSYKVVKRIYYSIVFRFHIIGVQVTIGRLGKYLGTKSRQQQLAESGLLEKKLYIVGEFHAWDNCTSIGISVIFYPCKQIKLY